MDENCSSSFTPILLEAIILKSETLLFTLSPFYTNKSLLFNDNLAKSPLSSLIPTGKNPASISENATIKKLGIPEVKVSKLSTKHKNSSGYDFAKAKKEASSDSLVFSNCNIFR